MLEEPQQKRPSTFFFPLRSNVHFFDSPQYYLALGERVKQASILYDAVFFEGGAYDAMVWPSQNMEMWTPPHLLNIEELRQRKSSFQPTGQEGYFYMTPEGGGEPLAGVSGPLTRHFLAEFHTFSADIQAHKYPWLRVAMPELQQVHKDIAARLTRADQANDSIRDLFKEDEYFLKSQVIQNLNYDLVLVSALRCAASIDPYFAGLLHHKQQPSNLKVAPGFLSLNLTIPNFALLPWEVIAEVRDMPAIKEFREKFVEIEVMTRSALPDADTRDIENETLKTINHELLLELANCHSSVQKATSNVVVNLVGGLLPSFISSGLSVAQGAGDMLNARSSWLTAFLRLSTNRWN